MKKEYIAPQINTIKFDIADIIQTSVETADAPASFTGAAQLENQTLEVFK